MPAGVIQKYYYYYNEGITSVGTTQGAISLGIKKRGKTETLKGKREEKVMGFSSTSLFPGRKREAVTQGEII